MLPKDCMADIVVTKQPNQSGFWGPSVSCGCLTLRSLKSCLLTALSEQALLVSLAERWTGGQCSNFNEWSPRRLALVVL